MEGGDELLQGYSDSTRLFDFLLLRNDTHITMDGIISRLFWAYGYRLDELLGFGF